MNSSAHRPVFDKSGQSLKNKRRFGLSAEEFCELFHTDCKKEYTN